MLLGGGVFRGRCMSVASAGLLDSVITLSFPPHPYPCIPVVSKQSPFVANGERRGVFFFSTSVLP